MTKNLKNYVGKRLKGALYLKRGHQNLCVNIVDITYPIVEFKMRLLIMKLQLGLLYRNI